MKCHLHGETDAIGTCVRCGRAICAECTNLSGEKMYCRDCCAELAGRLASAAAPKEPILSAVLSLVIAGLGQIYNGQVKKGIVFLVSDFVAVMVYYTLVIIVMMLATASTIFCGGSGGCCCVPFFIIPLIWRLYFAYGAYTDAVNINRGEAVKDWFD